MTTTRRMHAPDTQHTQHTKNAKNARHARHAIKYGTDEPITPIDGRYSGLVMELAPVLSEEALMRNRVKVEIEYYLALAKAGIIKGTTKIEHARLKGLYGRFRQSGAYKDIKAIEKKTNHDVKAVEYYIKSRVKKSPEFVHFGLTSEDVNNISYSLMLKEGIKGSILPGISNLLGLIKAFASKTASIPMLAFTHGQPASPTSLGKEFAVYYSRLKRQADQLGSMRYLGKLNGASGNFNAHKAAYPGFDWIGWSNRFIESLGLEPNPITYQIEPHDWLAEIFHCLIRINNIIINLDQDVWLYISRNYLIQHAVRGEVGSSTMPHKINPIDFENSEGNLGMANALLMHMASKLPITRLQRDLTDSTVIRNQGTALGYMLIGLKKSAAGLAKISANKARITEELMAHPEVIAEGIQTILRREGVRMPYERLKELTRGRSITLADIHWFIDSLKVSLILKKELRALTPENYTGLSKKLTGIALSG